MGNQPQKKAPKVEIKKDPTILDHMLNVLQQGHPNINLQDVIERARGCLFGAFIGDSIGSRIEFQQVIKDEDIKDALKMNGGGMFKLIPGQLTDDGELAISLALGLISSSNSHQIEDVISQILKFYHNWMNSNPFDFGMTMQSSWNPLIFKDWNSIFQNSDMKKVIQNVQENVKSLSANSQSNGFLMKQSPLAVFMWNQPIDVIFQFAEQDTLLTHCHPFCLDVSRLYIYALSQLIKRGNEHFKIYCECRDFALKYNFSQQTRDLLIEVESLFDIQTDNYISQVKPKSYKQVKLPDRPSANTIGWVKWAFLYSLIALLTEVIDVQKFFEFVLQQKGDTDTNLCIVGALIGARYGMKIFDQSYVDKVEKCRPENNPQQQRPQMYSPGQYKQLADQLVLNSLGAKYYTPNEESQIEHIPLLKNITIDVIENCLIQKIVASQIKQLSGSSIEQTDSQIKSAIRDN